MAAQEKTPVTSVPFFMTLLLVLGAGLLLAASASGRRPQRKATERQAVAPVTPGVEAEEGATPVAVAPSAGQAAECQNGRAAGYACHNVDLLSHLPLEMLEAASANDLWGWSNPQTGKDYAIVGVNNGTVFIDVTRPTEPIYLGKLPTHGANSFWRDVKVYEGHAFIVSEAGGHGMQIFDLRRLNEVTDPPVIFQETAHYDEFGKAHNIAINPQTGTAYALATEQGRSCGGGLHMIDITTPTSPTFAGCYASEGMIHETQCVIYEGPDEAYKGREICFNSSVNAFTIVDVTDREDPQQIASTGYPELVYVHQGWLTEDQRYFLLNDEFDELYNDTQTRIYTFDVTDLQEPQLKGIWSGPTRATSHNLYVRDGYVYAANYTHGMDVLQIGDLAQGQLEEVAHFDTYEQSDRPGWYHGAWTACPCFAEQDKVVISTVRQGLFVVRPDLPGD